MLMGKRHVSKAWSGLMCALLLADPVLVTAQAQTSSDITRARLMAPHQKGEPVRVQLADGTSLEGRIIRLEAETFIIRHEKTGEEINVPYAQVTEMSTNGRAWRHKGAWITAIIIGTTLLALCVAPYPFGFLCQEDNS
ncbi:MAG: hypothetical protein ACRD1Q_02535 [Vicinamibacterales bacterium]